MEIRLKPYHKNLYHINGILITGDTVLEWMSEICMLNIDLLSVEAYAVPGTKPNSLYGCVLFFNNRQLPKDIRKHQYLQFAANKLLVPEQSIYLPAVDYEELEHLAPGKKILLHPVAGTVILDEEVNWTNLLELGEMLSLEPQKPASGIHIPGRVNSFTLELNDEKLLNELLNPPSEKEILDNLPFDVQKLMKGNKQEMEKYLKYLEANPDKALAFALPLDVLGSFRGDNKGRFSFSGGWWQNLWGSGGGSIFDSSRSTGSGLNNVWYLVIALIIMIRAFTGLDGCSNSKNNFSDIKSLPVTIVNKMSVLDSHFNSLMASKKIALQFRKGASTAWTKAELNEMRKQLIRLDSSAKGIRDSLAGIYQRIVIRKSDSIVKAWQAQTFDSLKRIERRAGAILALKTKVNEAKKVKLMQTRYDLGVYYGTVKDSTAVFSLVTDPGQNKVITEPAKPMNPFKKTLLLIAAILGISLFFVWMKAPDTEQGKLGFGGDELSAAAKFFTLLILAAVMIYIIYPLIKMYGFGTVTILVSLVLVTLLYRLFSKANSILKSEND